MTKPDALTEWSGGASVPSFRSIFDGEFSYVWNTLRRLGVHEANVLDQAQEVFVIVHGLLPDYDASRPIRPRRTLANHAACPRCSR